MYVYKQIFYLLAPTFIHNNLFNYQLNLFYRIMLLHIIKNHTNFNLVT